MERKISQGTSTKQMEEGKEEHSKNYLPNLPTPLTNEEKKYLLAVERGDVATVRRMLQKSHRYTGYINKNCVDPLGRGALLMAIDNECLEMLELLVVMSVETRDALLHAIDKEFVEGVEVLLEHEEVIHKEGEPYSWEKVDRQTASFTPDITPLILAAHRDNYEILKILLDRGAVLPMPHDIRCSCEDCLHSSSKDSLNHSMSRINSYRALASPSLIALSSTDPILTAFELSWELKNLAYAENEFRMEYVNLRKQCKDFAEELLSHTRSSNELAIILNHDPDSLPYEDGEHMRLARIELAIEYKQKKFVSHPNVQQLLGAIWYEGLPGFKRKPHSEKFLEVAKVALLFPFYCVYYMIFPGSDVGKYLRTPFMKFLIHSSSYLFFLLMLILHSVRFDQLIVHIIGSKSMIRQLEENSRMQRGNLPTPIEWIVVIYIFGFIQEELREITRDGLRKYMNNMWNILDILRDSLYMMSIVLRIWSYFQQIAEIRSNPQIAYLPREDWNAHDPQLISEGLFAAANILSGLKLVHIFSINPYLGPLQISLGRMVIDIVKFFFIYSLVLFAFACGLTQLLWYFNDLEKQKCYSLPGGLPDWAKQSDSCMKWRRFHNVFEASQSLFWAGFGMVGLEDFELSGISEYTRFWSMLMFGTYSVINIIVLLNLLIAMMSSSYSFIVEHADSEWKFARTKLWMTYFDEGGTLPPPFNIFPNMKLIQKLTGQKSKDRSIRRMSTRTERMKKKARDYRYLGVMRAIIWRYVCSMQQKREERPITEDDVNEVKGDISALRFELIDLFGTNGMDVSACAKKSRAALGRKMRVWERRLMRDFYVSPALGKENAPIPEEPKESGDANALDRFRRIAKLAMLTNIGNSNKGSLSISQIGKTDLNDETRRETLKEAMENARKKMQEGTPDGSPGSSRGCSPYPDLYTGPHLLDAIRNLELTPGHSQSPSPQPQPYFKNADVGTRNQLNIPSKNPNKRSAKILKKALDKPKENLTNSKLEEKKLRNDLTTVTTVSEKTGLSKMEKNLHSTSASKENIITLKDNPEDAHIAPERKKISDLILQPLADPVSSSRYQHPAVPNLRPQKADCQVVKLAKSFENNFQNNTESKVEGNITNQCPRKINPPPLVNRLEKKKSMNSDLNSRPRPPIPPLEDSRILEKTELKNSQNDQFMPHKLSSDTAKNEEIKEAKQSYLSHVKNVEKPNMEIKPEIQVIPSTPHTRQSEKIKPIEKFEDLTTKETKSPIYPFPPPPYPIDEIKEATNITGSANISVKQGQSNIKNADQVVTLETQKLDKRQRWL